MQAVVLAGDLPNEAVEHFAGVGKMFGLGFFLSGELVLAEHRTHRGEVSYIAV